MSSEMQNKDFRVLLNTLTEETREKAQKKKGENIEQAERKRKKKDDKERGEGEETETTKIKNNDNDNVKKKEKEKEKEKEKKKNKYRNRAEERRKGIIKDIEDEAVLYDNKDNTIDESKFMGGDVEHTHLVKGLDFILLKKVRSNLNIVNGGESNFITFGEKREEEKDRLFLDLHNSSVDCKQIYKYFFLLEHPHHRDFRNKVKNISESIIEKNMKFQHCNKSIHNTFYKCNLNMEIEVNDIPPKYIVESEEVQRITTDYLGNGYLNELEDCFKWHAENKKKKKEDRLAKRTSHFLKNQNMQEEEEDPDFDIFAKVDREREVNSSDDNDDRVEMSSSDDSYSSGDNSTSSNVNKRLKVNDNNNYNIINNNNNNKNTLLNNVERTSTGLRTHQYNYTKFDISNTVEKEENKNAFENAFRDTYDECYPI